ncbi:MAG TPA: histidine phosphatase family protein [Candidatus Binatia bacterium]|nr:histidine phosphatase family protein [Candidatus Binatia bacterium]
MKWPNTLVAIRHGQSAYNVQKIKQEADPTYVEFMQAYDRFEEDPEKNRDEALAIAKLLHAEGNYRFSSGDHDTPITAEGERQAEVTGRELANILPLPDVIMVSPYLRTRQTLGHMAMGWPELSGVETIEEERLREQEHGLRAVYGDWRIFNVMFPDQFELRRMQGPYWYRHLQGENVPDVRERTRSLIGTVIREYSEQDVWWITHHLTKLSLRANFERFGAEEFLRLDEEEKPVNCGVTIYRGMPELGKDGKLELDAYNQQLY